MTTLEKKIENKIETDSKKIQLPLVSPSADVYLKDEKIFIELEMPAVKKETLEVQIEKDLLMIKADSDLPVSEYKLNYAEFTTVHYQRNFRLSDELDKDSIEANYKNGILEISIKKLNTISRKISVAS